MAMKARTQQEFPKKWVGVVEIKTGDTAAKLTSIGTTKEGKAITFPDGQLSRKIKLTDFSKLSLKVVKPGMSEPKKFRVRLNEDGDGVETVTPVSGVFRGHMTGLGPKKQDGSYKLIEKVYNKGEKNENSHLEFFATYEITQGVFKGVELPAYYLHYKFEGIPEGEEDDGFTRFNTIDSPQASQLHKLQAWAEVQGNILDEPIEWPDDGIILDVLEERALDADREVDIIFERGYIKTIQPVENYEDADEDESDVEEVESDDDLDEDDVAVDTAFPKDDVEEVVEPTPAKKASTKKSAGAKKIKSTRPADDDDDL